MGPIDFSKFDSIVDEYGKSFDFASIAKKIESLKTSHYLLFSNYIDLLADKKKLKEIVLAKPDQLLFWKNEFTSKLPFEYKKCERKSENIKFKKAQGENCDVCENCENNAKLSSFFNALLTVMDYEGNGRDSLRKVYSRLGIKACYICNAQYALSIDPEIKYKKLESIQGRFMSKFQFDHYLPKSKYPCFSISIYNLFPICSGCNSIKGDRDIGIDMFNKTLLKDAFKFKIVDDTLQMYLTGKDALDEKVLKIDFIDNYSYPPTIKKKLSERFDIKGIYNTQIDVIAELINRKLKYSESYKSTLLGSFPEVFASTTIDERLALGTYAKTEGIHQRPLSKFMQDINAQLDEYFEAKIKSIS